LGLANTSDGLLTRAGRGEEDVLGFLKEEWPASEDGKEESEYGEMDKIHGIGHYY
jgi:hypothetical protein